MAYGKIRNSEFFLAEYIYNCYFFQNDYKEKIEKSHYLKKIIFETLSKMDEERMADKYDLIDEMVYYSISGLDIFFNEFLEQHLERTLDIILDDISFEKQIEYNVVSLCSHSIIFFQKVLGKKAFAMKLYGRMELWLINEMETGIEKKYLIEQALFILDIRSESPQIFYPTLNYEVWKVFDQYRYCENLINQKNESSIYVEF